MLTNFSNIASQVEQHVRACGREHGSVKLVAVSKTVGLREVEDAIAQGASDFGENRPDQILEKSGRFPDVNWHFIGNIQSRQIKHIVACSSLIHSFDNLSHAKKIESAASEIGKVQHLLVEVNVSGEESKSGFSEDELPSVLDELLKFEHISADGLMTMAPINDEQHKNLPSPREVFSKTYDLFEKVAKDMPESFKEISAGMTNDWRDAIDAGSTIVRVGRAIFDPTLGV